MSGRGMSFAELMACEEAFMSRWWMFPPGRDRPAALGDVPEETIAEEHRCWVWFQRGWIASRITPREENQ